MTQTPRRRARELALQALYAVEAGEQAPDEVAENVIAGEDLSEKTREYALTLFRKTLDSQSATDEIIARLARNWEIGRIAMVDRIILRMAVTEMQQMIDVPVKVVLNEAIELAKEYSTAQSAAFVNGILDSFVKEQPDLSGA